MVKAFLTNHSHTQAYPWSTRRINPKITRRRSYSLQSSSPTTSTAAPPPNFAEINKSYTNRILLQCTIQISTQFHLTLPIFSRSNENIFMSKTFSSWYNLNSQLKSNLNISTCSTSQDLHIYIKKTAKRDDEFWITLKWNSLFTRAQALKSSRSTPLNLPCSFMQRESTETTWIFFNFQIQSTWDYTWTARILAQLIKTMVDSCSELHEDQESTKIFGVCVKKLKIRRERIWREFWNFRSENAFVLQLGLGFGFYIPC